MILIGLAFRITRATGKGIATIYDWVVTGGLWSDRGRWFDNSHWQDEDINGE